MKPPKDEPIRLGGSPAAAGLPASNPWEDAYWRKLAEFAEETRRTSELRARAERAEAAIHRVMRLAEQWRSLGGKTQLAAAAAILAALDSTDPPLDAQRPEERSDEQCVCGTPGTGDFDGPRRDCPVHGEPPALVRPTDVYCFCPDCIRCGCGMWERHHADVSAISPVPRRSSAVAIYDALQYHRSDAGLPDTRREERK